MNVTTRYCGRITKLAPNRDVARLPKSTDDLIDRPVPHSPSGKPTPAETLARLLDTHNWLRVRKNSN